MPLNKSDCVSCGDIFTSCDCTPNICFDCGSLIYADPAKHRFGIAWFGLLDCLDHTNDDLTNQEQMAKEKLLNLIQEIQKEK
jgi:hypothetical protein